jgi:hypothetical protein
MNNRGIAWSAGRRQLNEGSQNGRSLHMHRRAERQRGHVQHLTNVADGPRIVIVVVPDAADCRKKQRENRDARHKLSSLLKSKHSNGTPKLQRFV